MTLRLTNCNIYLKKG